MNARPTSSWASCSRSEESDDYDAIVARLNVGWRVIVCAAGIQWILQRHTGERHGRARWEGRSYCRTSEALRRCCREEGIEIAPGVLAVLFDLPVWLEEPAKRPSTREPAPAN